jgi:hypothetical protein
MSTTTTTMAPGKATHTMEVVVKASSVTQGKRHSGVGVVTSRHPRQKRSSTRGATGTPTSTRTAGEKWHTSSSSAMSLFRLAKHSRRRCAQTWPISSLSRGPSLTMLLHHHRIRRQTHHNIAIRPLRSKTSSNHGSKPSRKKHSRHHTVTYL